MVDKTLKTRMAKRAISLKLSPELLQAIDEIGPNRAAVIEAALIGYYRLKIQIVDQRLKKV